MAGEGAADASDVVIRLAGEEAGLAVALLPQPCGGEGQQRQRVELPRAGHAARVAVQVTKEWAGDVPWFESRPDLDATTGESGGFEVRGVVESQALRLVASAGDGAYVGDPQEVSVGATGVVLRLGRAGSVEGRVLVDEGMIENSAELGTYALERLVRLDLASRELPEPAHVTVLRAPGQQHPPLFVANHRRYDRDFPGGF